MAPGKRLLGNPRTDSFEKPGIDDLAFGRRGGRMARVGAFAHAIAHLRQRDFLPGHARPEFDVAFAARLRRAVAATYE